LAFDFFKNIAQKIRDRTLVRVMNLNGSTADYSSCDDDVLKHETVRIAVSAITSEFRKMELRHIETDIEHNHLTLVPGKIQDALFNPNPLMPVGDYLERVAYSLVTRNNAWVYARQLDRGKIELWPLSPRRVEFLRGQASGVTFIQMTFGDGSKTLFAYSEIGHARFNYGADDYMGGTGSEDEDNETLVKTLTTEHLVESAITKAAKAILQLTGIVRLPSATDEKKQEKKLREFEAKVDRAASGFVTLDPKAEFIPIHRNGSAVDKDLLSHLDKKILRHYRVSQAIAEGDFTPKQHRAFFQGVIEPMVFSIAQAHTKMLLTSRGAPFGERIQLYTNPAESMEREEIIELVKEVGGRGALTNNQILTLFGLPPYEGGNIRMMSLNYIDASLAAKYQMNNIKAGKEEKKNE